MIRVPYSLIVLLAIFPTLVGSSVAQNKPVPEKSVGPASLNSRPSEPATDTSPAANRIVSKAARESAKRSYKAGVNYGRGGLFRQAMQSFQQAIAYDPEFADAYVGLGQAYYDLGRYEEAITTLEKALKLNPQASDAYTRLGQAYTKLKEQGAATEKLAGKSSTSAKSAAEDARESAKADPTQIYNVGIGDVLEIRIPGSGANESTLHVVSGAGQLEHPILTQPLKVLGLTTEQIAVYFDQEMKRRSLTAKAAPEVSIRDYNSHRILVSGLVKEPGPKVLRREAIPLYVVIADAQPLSEAGVADVMSNQPPGSRTVELADPKQTALLVRPGDVVTLRAAPKRFFYVGGDVKSPGELPYRHGLTLTQAILSAGGVILKADKVQLTRGQGNGLLTTLEFKLKDINRGKTPDPLIEPGDRITVRR